AATPPSPLIALTVAVLPTAAYWESKACALIPCAPYQTTMNRPLPAIATFGSSSRELLGLLKLIPPVPTVISPVRGEPSGLNTRAQIVSGLPATYLLHATT